jgi:transposase
LASPPTIERFFRLIRALLAYEAHCREPGHGAVECDETTLGGKRPGKRGWGATGKVSGLGSLQRTGQVRVFPVQGRRGAEIIGLVRAHTRPGSLYYTDDWRAYALLAVRGDHLVVRKEGGRPKGRAHLNGSEGFWSDAQHWLSPYRGVPRQFFPLDRGEVSFRFNPRDEDLFPLVLQLMKPVSITKIEPILVRSS